MFFNESYERIKKFYDEQAQKKANFHQKTLDY